MQKKTQTVELSIFSVAYDIFPLGLSQLAVSFCCSRFFTLISLQLFSPDSLNTTQLSTIGGVKGGTRILCFFNNSTSSALRTSIALNPSSSCTWVSKIKQTIIIFEWKNACPKPHILRIIEWSPASSVRTLSACSWTTRMARCTMSILLRLAVAS